MKIPIEELRYNDRQDAVIDFRKEAREPRETEYVHGTVVVRTDVGDYEFCFMQLEDHFCVDMVLNRERGERDGTMIEESQPLGVVGFSRGAAFTLDAAKGKRQPGDVNEVHGWGAAHTIALISDL